MENWFWGNMDEELDRQMEKRNNTLIRFAVPEDRSLVNALMSLTKAELDDIRYNLCVQGISSLKKREMAEALAPAIIAFSHRWFVTIGMEQYRILQCISDAKGVWAVSGSGESNAAKPGNHPGIDAQDIRVDYMRCLGILFSGSYEGGQAWYLPNELLAIFDKMDARKFEEAVSLNEEVICLTTGLLFYYGYLSYDVLYERVTSFINTKLSFIDFMGVLFNAGCWKGNIVNAEMGMHYYTVMEYEWLIDEQLKHKDLAFKAFTYEEIHRAGQVNYIEETDAYKSLVGFFIKNFSFPVWDAADVVGELHILLLNDEKFNEMIAYVESVVDLPNEQMAEELIALLLAFCNSTYRWALKGHTPEELNKADMARVAPYMAKTMKNNVIQFVPRDSSVGRNDPCPCGSGKKYKRCCMGKEI